MRGLWHRLLVRLGIRKAKPFVLTHEMVARIGIEHLESNLVLRRFRERREP
jgi:hypothetical protein